MDKQLKNAVILSVVLGVVIMALIGWGINSIGNDRAHFAQEQWEEERPIREQQAKEKTEAKRLEEGRLRAEAAAKEEERALRASAARRATAARKARERTQLQKEQIQRQDIADDNSFTATALAKDAIKSMLKAPRTAKFPWFEGKCIRSENQIYEYFTPVDAQNSFGAMLRKNFHVKLQFLGGDVFENRNWKVIQCTEY